jgi:GNAT superfamily N-acetyltransferase
MELSSQLGYPMTLDQVADRVANILGRPGHMALVAVDEEVVGWIHCFVSHLLEYPVTFVEIGGLVVDERVRGKRIGSGLVAAAEEWTREQGLTDLRVRSASHRAQAHEFYVKLGFTLQKTQMRFAKTLC